MPLVKTETLRVRNVVDATRLGAWLRPGEGIGWLAAGTMPNSLYRMPVVYFFLACMRAWYCHHSPNQVFAYPACNNGDCSENLPSVPCTPVFASYQFTGSHRVGYWPEELRGRAPVLLGHSHSDSVQTLTLRHSDSHFETLSLLCSWLYIKA